ncbi:hypothetical protein [Gracilibacillus sp. JCM 18860]|uniref:hypothetical protein n=1 Tax=Gracilibacillus sp. JCM 18860 TaxID=1306159 RepID=UPI000ABDE308
MKRVGFFQSIRLKIIIILSLFLLLAVQLIGAYFLDKLETNLNTNFEANLDDRLTVLKTNLEEAFQEKRPENGEEPTLQEDVSDIIDRYSRDIFTDLQVIDSQYRVIGANSDLERIGKRVTGNIAINGALKFAEEEKEKFRYSNDRMIAKTVPIMDNATNTPVGAVRVEASIEDVYDQLEEISKIFLSGTILTVVVSIILGILVARTITKPITEMRKQAMVIAKGDFSKKVNVYGLMRLASLQRPSMI